MEGDTDIVVSLIMSVAPTVVYKPMPPFPLDTPRSQAECNGVTRA
jgi:hypothetical protein